MDANRYATKKTIAQGMLDIALLTANASQLKYILQVGEKHEFYTLMLVLISISIILQVSIFFACHRNPAQALKSHRLLHDYTNTASLTPDIFNTQKTNFPKVAMGILNLTLSMLYDCRLHLPKYHQSANVINYIVTAAAFLVTMLNLMISAFDPMVLKYVLD